MTNTETREQEWQAYLDKMMALDAANNLAGRGLIPSWRDWHAGYDACAARIAELERFIEDQGPRA